MTFRKRRKRNEEHLEIKLRDETIPFKESTRFLGMTLDSRLNWEEYINNLKAKAKRSLNTMKAIAGKNGVGQENSKKSYTIFESFLKPK